jgi:hypothetical protein
VVRILSPTCIPITVRHVTLPLYRQVSPGQRRVLHQTWDERPTSRVDLSSPCVT